MHLVLVLGYHMNVRVPSGRSSTSPIVKCPVQIDYSCRLVAFEWFILEIKFQRIGLLLANLPSKLVSY